MFNFHVFELRIKCSPQSCLSPSILMSFCVHAEIVLAIFWPITPPAYSLTLLGSGAIPHSFCTHTQPCGAHRAQIAWKPSRHLLPHMPHRERMCIIWFSQTNRAVYLLKGVNNVLFVLFLLRHMSSADSCSSVCTGKQWTSGSVGAFVGGV